jgi:hypothetical protein
MEFGTPVDERQKAANTAKVQAAANVDTDLTDEAVAEGVSVTELSGTDSTPDAETAGSVYGEGTKENLSLDQEFTLERKKSVVPVTTAVKAAVTDTRTGPNGEEVKLSSAGKYFYIDSAGNANILPGETRDEPESQAAIAAEVAKVETQTTVEKKSKEVKATADLAVAENNRKKALGDARMNEEVNKITYKITLETVGMTDGNYWHKVEGTYTGDLSIDKTPFENKRYKFRSRTFAGNQARSLVLAHFRKLLVPLVKEEVGL